MNLKKLTSAIILASLPASSVFAAAMDRSGQSIQAFLQPGNYFEAGISVLDADVSGTMKEDATGQLKNTPLGDMANSYYFPNAALKFQINEHFSAGLIYDQPFGADAEYEVSGYCSTPSASKGCSNSSGAFNSATEGTKVEVKSQNLSLIAGYQPTENWNIYGGAVYQTVKGNIKLAGSEYSLFSGYGATIKENSAAGWLAGIAYQIPEIALKASVTYRSEIDHSVNATEEFGGLLNLSLYKPAKRTNGKTDITTPQSVNIDLQSGIMANTVAFAQLRWVDWSNFSIRPHQFGEATQISTIAGSTGKPTGFDLIAYDKDQISANVGVGRKFNDQWAGTVMVGWDSGAGNPVSTLGPTDGYWSVGLGGQFSPTPQSFIQAGVKYFMLGDAKSQVASVFGSDEYSANFKDNDAIGYSLKIGYRF